MDDRSFIITPDSFRRQLAAYHFFDVNLWMPDPSLQSFFDGSSLKSVLAKAGSYQIGRAIVATARGYRQSPVAANQELTEAIADLPEAYGAAMLAPDASYEPGGFAAYLERLIARKVVLVRMFPRKLNFALTDWCLGDQLAVLEQRRFPLMIWHTETDFDTLARLCERHPDLPVILEGNDKKLLYHNRSYVPLLKNYQNLYLETHNFIQYLGYEFFDQQQLGERLIFGTYLPANDPGAAVAPILAADIPESLKRRIASENLENLIAGIRK
ncbi:MAG TPA: hypothetical protein DD640_02230 [Clostridiales bacterium]|nr:hypothetical protein [Clostridiales bacterium]